MKSEHLWDTVNNKPDTDIKSLKTELKNKNDAVTAAEKELSAKEADKTKATKTVDVIKSQIKQSPVKDVINVGTKTDPTTGDKTRTINTSAEIDTKLADAKTMAAKQVEKNNAAQKVAAAKQAREQMAAKEGITADTKPNPNGTHSKGSQDLFDKLDAKKAETMTSYTDYVTRAAAK
jgi:hypothetical protein